jgi:hypothetical protein
MMTDPSTLMTVVPCEELLVIDDLTYEIWTCFRPHSFVA